MHTEAIRAVILYSLDPGPDGPLRELHAPQRWLLLYLDSSEMCTVFPPQWQGGGQSNDCGSTAWASAAVTAANRCIPLPPLNPIPGYRGPAANTSLGLFRSLGRLPLLFQDIGAHRTVTSHREHCSDSQPVLSSPFLAAPQQPTLTSTCCFPPPNRFPLPWAPTSPHLSKHLC